MVKTLCIRSKLKPLFSINDNGELKLPIFATDTGDHLLKVSEQWFGGLIELVNKNNNINLRDLLAYKSKNNEIPINEVENINEIRKKLVAEFPEQTSRVGNNHSFNYL